MAVLLKAPVKIEELVPLLEGFEVEGPHEASARGPLVAGPSLTLEYSPKLGGVIEIDVVDRPWPDSMGGVGEDPALLAAWGTGYFGPFCSPGSLGRACQHNYTWREGSALAASHRAFLRIRLSYSLDSESEQARVPRGAKPAEECETMLAVAEALLEHPGALCYFNPNGETLAPLAALAQICEHYSKAGAPAINLLANRRIAKIENSDWMIMDTVGMGQLDVCDLEVCFREEHDPNEIAVFLVNSALATTRGTVYKDKHTLTGPRGVLFEVRRFSESILPPQREVLRLRPRDGTVSPPELGFGDKPLGKSAWWQFWKL